MDGQAACGREMLRSASRGLDCAAGLVRAHPRVQELDVSGNELTTLQPLGGLRDLVWLDASGNRLASALDMAVPQCGPSTAWAEGDLWVGSSLEEAHLSDNEIRSLQQCVAHPNLRVLDLSQNLLAALTDLSRLRWLRTLRLANNQIEGVKALGTLPALEELSLDGNRLRDLRVHGQFPRLRTLTCAGNRLSAIDGLETCSLLERVDLRDNALAHFGTLEPLRGAMLLTELVLMGNPLQREAESEPVYRRRVLFRLEQLAILDEEDVSVQEKVSADNFFGADREHREKVFAAHFASEPFMEVVPPFVDPDIVRQRLAPAVAAQASCKAVEEGMQAAWCSAPVVSKVFVAGVLGTRSVTR